MRFQGMALALMGSLVITITGFAYGQATPKVPSGWAFTLPDGNAKDGQTVFMRMECYSCHVMKGLKEKPPTGAGGSVPI